MTQTDVPAGRDRALRADAAAAARAAGQVAARTADPQVLASAVAAARAPWPASLLAWRPASLAQGHAGLAVLCAELDARQPGSGWDRAGHHHLAAAAAAVSRADASLFSGLAGLGFAATMLAAGRTRYERLLGQVDEGIAAQLDGMLQRLAAASGCRVSDFDLVSGVTGTGTYLLTRYQATAVQPAVTARKAGQPPAATEMLQRLLQGLAELFAAAGHPRRWHTPAGLASGPLRLSYPRGLHNCGLAHGAPGPLALLSLAKLAGLQVPGGADAIRATASWLARHRTGPDQEPDWPDGVALDAAGPPLGASGQPPGRAAWCYGAPGVARSLWLAGAALAERQWQELAAAAIRAIASRPAPSWGLTAPGFCHGEAGLLQILRRFAADRPDPAVASAADRLAASLAARFDPGAPLGVRIPGPDGAPADQPGLLDGTAGIALALLGLPEAGPAPRAATTPSWDRVFLLA